MRSLSDARTACDRAGHEDFALIEHGDRIGDLERAFELVRHDDDRHAQRIAQAQDQLVELGRDDRIEARRRLVEEEELRIHHDRARERCALDHAAGQLARHQILKAAEVDDFELEPAHDADRRRIERRVLAQRQRDVLADRQRRQQRAALERNADAPMQIEHLAIARAAQINAEDAHRCRCAAACRPSR